MPSTTYGAGDQAFADSSPPPPADCAYLHSAFGPGCPYCEEAAAHAASGNPRESSVRKRQDHGRDLGAVA